MRLLIIALITFYQRFISPFKGFKCAHNALHKQGSCSHSVKALVKQHGVLTALPMARARFKECGRAYSYLKVNRNPLNQELACDVPCDFDIGSCTDIASCGDFSFGSDTGFSCDMFGACDFLPDWKQFSKRTKQYIIAIGLVGILILSYVFYGRGIEAVYLIDKGEQNVSLLARLAQRGQADVRLLLVVDGEKYYSDIMLIEKTNVEYKFVLDKTVVSSEFDRLEVLDARLNVADKLVVLGQKLETFNNPSMQGQGQRFDYRIKRRWHLF